ncbi:MAG: hypothetical protein QOF14_5774 [Hyphomicrobiales bacterium]|jgi:hypothetical protein|nr:hypothetical protein [Hyphomicrobiales bacterium]
MTPGTRALAHAFVDAKRLDQLTVESSVKGVEEEVEGMIDELLFTDVMKQVLCSENDFAFTGHPLTKGEEGRLLFTVEVGYLPCWRHDSGV